MMIVTETSIKFDNDACVNESIISYVSTLKIIVWYTRDSLDFNEPLHSIDCCAMRQTRKHAKTALRYHRKIYQVILIVWAWKLHMDKSLCPGLIICDIQTSKFYQLLVLFDFIYRIWIPGQTLGPVWGEPRADNPQAPRSICITCDKHCLSWLMPSYSISQEICTRFCCALLCCGYAIVHNEFTWSIYPYSSGLLCWHWGNRSIATVPVK